jgi:hypothetical protein
MHDREGLTAPGMSGVEGEDDARKKNTQAARTGMEKGRTKRLLVCLSLILLSSPRKLSRKDEPGEDGDKRVSGELERKLGTQLRETRAAVLRGKIPPGTAAGWPIITDITDNYRQFLLHDAAI